MKKILLILVAGMATSVSLHAALTIYTSKTAWETAVNNTYQTENFTDATLNPGVSFVSNAGSVGSGLWNDRVVIGGDQTTWNFSSALVGALVGWGGNFDLSPGGAGQGLAMTLELYAGGNVLVSTEIPNSYTGQFWGVVTDQTFDAVIVRGGSQAGVAETYSMDDMVYSAVPEPSTCIAGALLLLPFATKIRVLLKNRAA
jgi:hypothetical protein